MKTITALTIPLLITSTIQLAIAAPMGRKVPLNDRKYRVMPDLHAPEFETRKFTNLPPGTSKAKFIELFGPNPEYVSAKDNVLGWTFRTSDYQTFSYRIKFDQNDKALSVYEGSYAQIFYAVPLEQNILGKWLGKSNSGQAATFVFSQDGKVAINITNTAYKNKTFEWQIDQGHYPIALDLDQPKFSVYQSAIMQFVSKDRLMIRLPDKPDADRPRNFDSGLVLYLVRQSQ